MILQRDQILWHMHKGFQHMMVQKRRRKRKRVRKQEEASWQMHFFINFISFLLYKQLPFFLKGALNLINTDIEFDRPLCS